VPLVDRRSGAAAKVRFAVVALRSDRTLRYRVGRIRLAYRGVGTVERGQRLPGRLGDGQLGIRVEQRLRGVGDVLQFLAELRAEGFAEARVRFLEGLGLLRRPDARAFGRDGLSGARRRLPVALLVQVVGVQQDVAAPVYRDRVGEPVPVDRLRSRQHPVVRRAVRRRRSARWVSSCAARRRRGYTNSPAVRAPAKRRAPSPIRCRRYVGRAGLSCSEPGYLRACLDVRRKGVGGWTP
jgi:hypothetical protein